MDLPVYRMAIAIFLTLSCVGNLDAEICTSSVCQFELDVTLFGTMTFTDEFLDLYPVTFNGSQLQTVIGSHTRIVSPDEVIIADGFPREIIRINGQFPGPTLEVMEGAEIVVKVNNMLTQKSITVHWHGMIQNYTNYMDGAAGITQCPIPPGQSFTYRFSAYPHGTHWYHSHVAAQRLDGLFGMLVVHKALPTIPYFNMIVQDWYHVPSEVLEMAGIVGFCENGAIGAPYKNPLEPIVDCSTDGAGLDRNFYQSSLFDGRNQWNGLKVPLREYVVKQGHRYRVRMLNAGHVMPFEIQIDDHPLTIVASDGADIKPINVDSIFMIEAETYDFEFFANQTPGRYWIRADTQCPGAYARGVLVYEEFEFQNSENQTTDYPISTKRDCTNDEPCIVFNCPFGQYPADSNKTCIPIVAAESTLSTEELQQMYGVGDTDVLEYALNFGMNTGASVNGRRFMMPMVALNEDPSAATECVGEPCLDGCHCRCTQTLEIPFGRTVQLVISNMQPDETVLNHAYHTIHMHGHDYAVLAEEFAVFNESTGQVIHPNSDVTCDSDICAHPGWSNGTTPDFSWVLNPVIKDSVLVPYRGYVVLRFVARNPGLWLLHCHIDAHFTGGMGILMKVAPELFPELPTGFPTCFQYNNGYDDTHVNNMTQLNFF